MNKLYTGDEAEMEYREWEASQPIDEFSEEYKKELEEGDAKFAEWFKSIQK